MYTSFSLNACANRAVVEDVDKKKDNLVKTASTSLISKCSKIVWPWSYLGEVRICSSPKMVMSTCMRIEMMNEIERFFLGLSPFPLRRIVTDN